MVINHQSNGRAEAGMFVAGRPSKKMIKKERKYWVHSILNAVIFQVFTWAPMAKGNDGALPSLNK